MPLIRKDPGPAPAANADDARRLLLSGTPEQRWSAARALAGSPEAASVLASALGVETEARVREAMLTGLARCQTAEALDAILPLLRSEDAALRTSALDAMRTMPDAVRARLPTLLADEDGDVRLLACELARTVPAGEAQALLCDLLDRSAEVNVCAAAVEILAEIGDTRARPALERCASRFASDPFLGFSIGIALQSTSARG